MSKQRKKCNYITQFNPHITALSTKYRDLLHGFNAGVGNENFNVFLNEDAEEYRTDGNGVTYIIWNITYDENDKSLRDIVAYFTLSANAIPYTDRIKLDAEDVKTFQKEFDEENWGVPVLEIKMFAVNDKYQDMFYVRDGKELPIAAWCLLIIIRYAGELPESVLGFKALYLQSVPEAEKFYFKNGFQDMRINMHPFKNIDSDMRSMWLPLKKVHMNYEK